MTEFHTDGTNLVSDPFDETEIQRRIVVTPVIEGAPILNARTLAAAFWASYFTLHWLLLLGVVETTWNRIAATLYFFLAACVITVQIAARDLKEKRDE